MTEKKNVRMLVFLLLLTVLLSGCKEQEREEAPKEFVTCIRDGSLEKVSYRIKAKAADAQVKELITALKKDPKEEAASSIFPEKAEIESWKLEKGRLVVSFGKEYANISPQEEVLFRAGFVETMTQLSSVEKVLFLVGEEPLKDREQREVGEMDREDFLENTGLLLQTYQSASLKLYYANKKGDRLEEEQRLVRYSSSSSIEKVILEQLLKREEGDPILPENTKVLGVSVRNQVCYVNLDEEFLKNTYAVDPKITIYGIVNSVIENGKVDRVQISVNGDTNIQYLEKVDLSKPLKADWKLLEKEEE
ncbi:GerMN domain-containing protein [Suipraeoptans intestinalis]|uniref:GerMN domain-containing protein n=1 Tax=Suipraeoptans intestinalis TaxID=2606628 RepID=UPI002A758354|nr:GerMN domain-containing protein [Suipraeoptans intestinalis]MDY3122425.1 GerMN domain-containing protein [Suipraeoptans intestinalis]